MLLCVALTLETGSNPAMIILVPDIGRGMWPNPNWWDIRKFSQEGLCGGFLSSQNYTKVRWLSLLLWTLQDSDTWSHGGPPQLADLGRLADGEGGENVSMPTLMARLSQLWNYPSLGILCTNQSPYLLNCLVLRIELLPVKSILNDTNTHI